MDNSTIDEVPSEKSSSWVITGIIISLVLLVLIYVLFKDSSEPVIPPPVEVTIVDPIPEPEVIIENVVEDVIEEAPVVAIIEAEPEPVVDPLPELNESDSWVQEKLADLTWRKELLKLMVNDDMIRRFVVFTDNFSQGILAYEHSPFINPKTSFTAIDGESEQGEPQLLWDDNSYKRFSIYVELIRTFDSETLVQWYISLKPLIDEAYEELGYPDEDFTPVLREAIVKVLDMELPKEVIELDRPSVMYRYKSEDLESLDDTEKLLLRIGKQNLLVIKSVLLEINDKLARNVTR